MRAIEKVDAVILGGRRAGVDPLARVGNAPHRALVEIEHTTMLERVLAVLQDSGHIARIAISIDQPELLEPLPGLARARKIGDVTILRSEASPSVSAVAALDSLGTAGPVLVTTADHALLDQRILSHFLGEAQRGEGDISVGLVEERVLRERFPESKRTYLPLRGARYSGANLFYLRMPAGRRAVEFWRRAEMHRKRPWRLVASFGLPTLLLFALRRMDLPAAFRRASGVIEVRAVPVVLPYAEAAIDVDTPDDLMLVREIIAAQQAAVSR